MSYSLVNMFLPPFYFLLFNSSNCILSMHFFKSFYSAIRCSLASCSPHPLCCTGTVALCGPETPWCAEHLNLMLAAVSTAATGVYLITNFWQIPSLFCGRRQSVISCASWWQGWTASHCWIWLMTGRNFLEKWKWL